jgi:hypothetical protein
MDSLKIYIFVFMLSWEKFILFAFWLNSQNYIIIKFATCSSFCFVPLLFPRSPSHVPGWRPYVTDSTTSLRDDDHSTRWRSHVLLEFKGKMPRPHLHSKRSLYSVPLQFTHAPQFTTPHTRIYHGGSKHQD